MNAGRQLELRWTERQGRGCLRASGWTDAEFRELGGQPVAELSRQLAVLPSEVLDSGVDLRAIRSIPGRFEIDQDAVCFIPRFPFQEGISYSLLVGLGSEERSGDRPEVWSIQHPARESSPTTEVVAIYPSVDQLPLNQLKFYIHFSSPMSEGWAARAVQVLRADTRELIEGVFLPTESELWDRDRRRITLFLDPGRIKRGLVPNEEIGYPLTEGVPIVLFIDSEFRDAEGRPLKAGTERRFEIGPPLMARVAPTDWQCRFPSAGATEPLTVEFDRPLDHALLQHSLWVNDGAGVALAGRVSIGPAERCWRFEPQSPWQEGQHQLIIDPRLEDLAGNSLVRVFDRDLTQAENTPTNKRQAVINFTCAPPLLR